MATHGHSRYRHVAIDLSKLDPEIDHSALSSRGAALGLRYKDLRTILLIPQTDGQMRLG